MKYIHHCFILLLTLALWACEKEDIVQDPPVSQEDLKAKVHEIMQEWYLWNNELPTVDVATYETADDLLYALRKNPLDKWSYIEKEEDYDNYFNNGEYEGYGFRMEFDQNDKLRIAFIYQQSPFNEAGVGRSWIIDKINGKIVERGDDELPNALNNATNTFEFIDTAGVRLTKSITKTTIEINSVLYKNVYEIDGLKIGYLVFNNFLQTSLPELQETFSDFKQAGIQELILDLRYNGGGRVNMASYIASNILGARGQGHDFVKFVFNQDKTEENEATPFEEAEYPLDLNRLLVIASENTASASELVINGLKPFMEVVLIGEDTYGKPVGSFPFKYEGYAINPISFKTANENGEGEYFEGITANAYVQDDLTHDFGDVKESRLKEALYYAVHNSFSGEIARTRPFMKGHSIPWQGFRQEIGAY